MNIINFNAFNLMHINRTVPNCMVRYYSDLDDTGIWAYFEAYHTLRLICLSEVYLHDALKFVLKNSSNDLVYDFYVFLMFDDLCSVISSDAMNHLNDKYYNKFEDEFNFDEKLLEQLGDFDIELMDNLPF